MEKVRFGIIGLGNMGSGHLHTLFVDKAVEGAVLTAVCDLKPERIEWAKSICGDQVKYYTDYKELLASGEVDAIHIATPHYLHPVIAIEAFAAGLNVMSEKPAGVYTKQVEAMNKAAAESGKVFGVMFNQRTNPLYQKARELIQSGELGEVVRSTWLITDWYRTQAYYDSGDWRATWSGEGGGVLMNQCPHNLDLWQWIVGLPSRVRASCRVGKYHDIEVEDSVIIEAEYPNGAEGTFITTTGECPGTNRLEIDGDRGKIVIENGTLHFSKLDVSTKAYTQGSAEGFKKPEITELDVECPGENSQHRGILQDFTNAILHGTPLLAAGEEGIRGLSISNAAYLSSWHDGEWIDLPIDADRYWTELQGKIATSRRKTDVKEVVFSTEGTYGDNTKK